VTVPKWIAAALEDATPGQPFRGVDDDALAAALIERLPIEAMVRAVLGYNNPRDASDLVRQVVRLAVSALSDGDTDAVTLTALYQEASKALDVAGVPYANNDEVPVPLDLSARIRWLAQQRPTRLDLQRVEAERDEARANASEFRRQLDELARHVKGSPLGWVDGRTMVHRSTADSDVAEWLQRLEALALGAD
jgi:hypothetical protein